MSTIKLSFAPLVYIADEDGKWTANVEFGTEIEIPAADFPMDFDDLSAESLETIIDQDFIPQKWKNWADVAPFYLTAEMDGISVSTAELDEDEEC